MESSNVAYLINSTPKYYYILELHLVLLRRYAPNLKWQVFLATEMPEHPICKLLQEKYDVKLLILEKENSSFLTSRKRALELLPEQYSMVLPMQEDFLLERYIDEESIEKYIGFLEEDNLLTSIRLMPCPGPNINNFPYNDLLNIRQENDSYGFCFQATLWKRDACQKWFDAIVKKVKLYPNIDSKRLEVDINIAENADGQKLFFELFQDRIQLGWPRAHKHPNAVYMCPWPYRPTAIIRGKLQPFAIELASREGVILNQNI